MKSCNILETNSQSQAVECPMLPFIRPRRRGKAILGSPELDFSASDKHSVLESATEKMQPFEHVMADLRLRCIAAGLLRADEHLQLDCRAHGVQRRQQVY